MAQQVHVVDVIRHGTQITLPEKMSYDDAISTLKRRQDYEEQEISISETFDTFVWDGAMALQKAIKQMFGWADAQEIHSFFGSQKPQMIQIEIGVGENTLVPWGRFSLPGIENGYLQTSVTKKKGKVVFCINATVKRKYEKTIQALCKLTREFLAKESIYKGKAIKIKFSDNDVRLDMPEPQFIDTSKTKIDEIVFSEDVQNAINGNLLTPILHADHCRKYKIPLKRGILLSGTYGTGKTLVSNATAKVSTDNGWTFLMTERADELAEMVEFAKQYQPAVVFCEDVDRVVEGERSVDMDSILNIIDGIESKHTEIMIVLTTNHVEKINKAMLRPGRLDAVINVLPPDAKAVEKLIWLYGRGLVPKTETLEAIGIELAGQIPAVIRECVERAKLYAIADGKLNGNRIEITSENLLNASKSMKMQLDLLQKEDKKKSPEQVFGESMMSCVKTVVEQANKKVVEAVDDIHDHVC